MLPESLSRDANDVGTVWTGPADKAEIGDCEKPGYIGEVAWV